MVVFNLKNQDYTVMSAAALADSEQETQASICLRVAIWAP